MVNVPPLPIIMSGRERRLSDRVFDGLVDGAPQRLPVLR